MTDPLKAAEQELISAEEALRRMQDAKTFADYERAWREVLVALEKCWVKVERAAEPHRSKFQPWQGTYTAMRRKDRLLSYLRHARNADTHSIAEIVEHSNGVISIGRPGEMVAIESIVVEDFKLKEFKGRGTVKVEKPGTRLLPVVDSGRTYFPPLEHNGQRLSARDPMTVGFLGLAFYRDFLNSTRERFFSSP